MKEGRKPRTPVSLLVLFVLMILTGCQNIFTYTPLKGLQRDPSTLSSEQRLVYAQDALASGDKAAMLSAYNAIKTDTSADAVHLSAELEFELSGVPGLINDAITNESLLTQNGATLATYIAAHPATEPALMMDAGLRILALDSTGFSLGTNDRLLGAIGLALLTAQVDTASYDLTNVPVADLAASIGLIAGLVSSGDTFAISLNTYLNKPAPR